jgi:hypothetical protein
MYDVVTNNLIIREWLNGSLFPLSLNLSLIIAVFLWDSYFAARESRQKWFNMDGVPTACALFWIFSLDGVRAVSVWVILRINNNGMEVPMWMRQTTNVALALAAFGLMLTILRCTYLFTPPRWGNRYWIYSLVSTLIFLMISHILP